MRAGEPVRDRESRCSSAPLLTLERIIRVRERERERSCDAPHVIPLVDPVNQHEGSKDCHYDCRTAIGCSERVMRALRAWRGSALRGCRGRARPLRFADIAGMDPCTSVVPARAAPKVGVNRAGDDHRQVEHERQISLDKCRMGTCHWVRPERLGDDAVQGVPPAR